MYTLKNQELIVSILDPIADAQRLGSRYCTGGYIWQVEDTTKGELLSGPVYPKEPDTFNGQGMPDMFQMTLGAEGVPVGGVVGCVGVGSVRRTSDREPFDVRYNPEVAEFVKWQVNQTGDAVTMTTDHTYQGWAYHLVRTVNLQGRAIISRTEIRNQGQAVIPVRWFAHPFFPIPEDNVLCRCSPPVSMPENPGYVVNADGFVARKPEHDWTRGGWYQPLEYDKSASPFSVVQKHDKVGEVSVATDFMPVFLPIWGNQITFSFEPYFERELAAGQSASWEITYRF